MSPQPAEKRTERLLNLVIALLSSRRGFTKHELFEEIELYSEATTPEAREKLFDRDKAFLREQGIPVESYSDDLLYEQDNSVQRYRIRSEEYSLPEVAFTSAESAVLALAAQMWEQAAFGSAAARALRKLRARGVITEDTTASPIQPGIRTADPNFTAVFRAASNRQPISFGYRATGGAESTRHLQPWGMGSRYGHWYVVGWDNDRQAERFFRLSRMTTPVKTGKGNYTVPAGFDIHASLASLDSVFPPQTGVVDVLSGSGAELRLRAADADRPVPAGLPDPAPGRDRLYFSVTDFDALAADTAALGPAAEAIHPGELRSAVRDLLAKALAAQEAPVPDYRAPVAARSRSPKPAGAQEHLSRLLDLVPYILANQGADMDDTARRFGISRDQLAADLNLLFVSGPRYYPNGLMDVNFETGEIFIDNADNLSQPVRLAMDEAAALIVGLDTLAALPGAAPTDAVTSAHTKLSEAAGTAGAAGSTLAATLVRSGSSPAVLEELRNSIGRRRLSIRYVVPSRDEVSERVVDPRRIFSENDTWYLDAWCHRAEAPRFFRVDRILSWEDAGPLPEGVPQPDQHFPASLFTPGETDESVTIRLTPEAGWVAEAYHAELRSPLPDGGQAIVLRTPATGWIPGFIARLGGSAAVAAPEELRARTTDWLAAALENYG